MYKKGFSIVELIISIALLSIVLVFMTNLLIKLNSNQNKTIGNANVSIDQSIISKDLNKDIAQNDGIKTITCSTTTSCQLVFKNETTKTLSISADKKSLVYETGSTTDFIKKLSGDYEFEGFTLSTLEFEEESFYKLVITVKDNPKYNIEIYSFAPPAYHYTYTVGQTFLYAYTGSATQIEIKDPGVYKLEVWGAQGGYRSSSSYGGLGGYSVGEVSLTSGTILYIYVGGAGNTGGTSGGFNGGGTRSTYSGGGGATDMRIGGTSLYNRFIVAGGGGSDGAANKAGGYGGGLTGESRTDSYGTGGGGGSQTTGGTGGSGNGGTYGAGGTGLYYASGYAGAGGGGWYGGGGAYPDGSGDDDRGGGGGSGYVWTSSTSGNKPSGYLVDTQYYLSNANTYAGNTSFIAPGGGNETGHAGNGYARITVVSLN